MQKGNYLTAHITSLDPGNANKRFAYTEFKAIDGSVESYAEVMLSGYQDYRSEFSGAIKHSLPLTMGYTHTYMHYPYLITLTHHIPQAAGKLVGKA